MQMRQSNASRCNTLQCTATHCSALQHNAVHCNTLQCIAAHCSTLQQHCNTLQQQNYKSSIVKASCRRVRALVDTATLCSALQHTALHPNTHCRALQHTAGHCTSTHCRELQDTAGHCNTLQQQVYGPSVVKASCRCIRALVDTATHRRALQHTATALQHTAAALQHTAAALQHTAVHCNTLQGTAAQSWAL